MIEELATYQISDFLLFSQDVLYQLFRSYNQDIWPMQLVWLGLAVALLALLRHGTRLSERVSLVIVAAAWLWIGLVFHQQYFTTINWAAKYFAWIFVLQAVLLLVSGIFSKRANSAPWPAWSRALGFSLFVASVLMPIGLLLGQHTEQLQQFGWGADHTALGTLGVLLLVAHGPIRWLLMVIPVLWLGLSGLMYFGLQA